MAPEHASSQPSCVRCGFTTVAIAVILFCSAASAAQAALTTEKCLVLKRKVWITLRKCQGTEDVKRLNAKPANFAKCTTKFQDALAKIDARAAKAGIACRYRDNGDGTITDFDTGLMWEKKIETILGFPCDTLFGSPSCVTRTYSWTGAMSEFIADLKGFADFGALSQSGHAGHTDWRLPTTVELLTIADPGAAGCGSGSPCIDPVFGPTRAGGDEAYWSATTRASDPDAALTVSFRSGSVGEHSKTSTDPFVRAVRAAL